MSEQNNHYNWKRRPGIFGPLLLITAGIIFLANNLGILPGDFWDVLLKMWPVILVLAGIDGIIRGDGLVWPLVLVLFGGFLTMRNFGLVAFTNWDRLWRLWPLILVALGVDLILKERTPWRTFAGVVMLVILLGAGVWLVGYSGDIAGLEPLTIQETDPGNLEGLVMEVRMAAGEFLVETNSMSEELIFGVLRPEPEIREYFEKDQTGFYRAKSESPVVFPRQGVWNITVLAGIPLELTASQGAGEMEIDLDYAILKTARIEQGVGKMEIFLPEQAQGDIIINQAIGKITIYVPEDTAVQIKTNRALSTLDLPDEFRGEGGVYSSDSGAEKVPQLRITISQAIGLIQIRYY